MSELDKATENLRSAMTTYNNGSSPRYKGHFENRSGLTHAQILAHKERNLLNRLQYGRR